MQMRRLPRAGQRAEEALGERFLLPTEVARVRGMRYTEAEIVALYASLPERTVLEELQADGYYLIPGPPTLLSLSALCWLDKDVVLGRELAASGAGFATRRTCAPGWLAIDATSVRTFVAQGMAESALPSVAQSAWCHSTYRQVRGERLFAHPTPTRDVDTIGCGVLVASHPVLAEVRIVRASVLAAG